MHTHNFNAALVRTERKGNNINFLQTIIDNDNEMHIKCDMFFSSKNSKVINFEING